MEKPRIYLGRRKGERDNYTIVHEAFGPGGNKFVTENVSADYVEGYIDGVMCRDLDRTSHSVENGVPKKVRKEVGIEYKVKPVKRRRLIL